MEPTTPFNWSSQLGLSVLLFLFYGSLYLIIGILTPIFWDHSSSNARGLIVSYRTDKELFGSEPLQLEQVNKPLHTLRRITLHMIAGLLSLIGILVVFIAWFGLKSGQGWCLWALGISGLLVLPFWYLALKPYWNAGINIALSDAPPFIWVPLFIYLPAVILGWLGLKS